MSYKLRIILEYFQPKIGRRIRIFSLGRKNNILIKKKKSVLSNELMMRDFCQKEQSWLCKDGVLGKFCSFSRLITKQDNVLLQFTTARLITIYDSVLLLFAIAWSLQFSTTVITMYDRYYNSRHYYNSTQARRASCGTTV